MLSLSRFGQICIRGSIRSYSTCNAQPKDWMIDWSSVEEDRKATDKATSEVKAESKSSMKFKLFVGGTVAAIGLMIYSDYEIWQRPLKLAALKKDLNELPLENLRSVLSAHPEYLSYIQNPTQELCLIAIRSDASVIKDCHHRKQPEFQKKAILANANVFSILIKNDLNFHQPTSHEIELMQFAIQSQPSLILQLSPDKVRSIHDNFKINLWSIAVEANWELLRLCPIEYQTEHVCTSAVDKCRYTIEYIQDRDLQLHYARLYDYHGFHRCNMDDLNQTTIFERCYRFIFG